MSRELFSMTPTSQLGRNQFDHRNEWQLQWKSTTNADRSWTLL